MSDYFVGTDAHLRSYKVQPAAREPLIQFMVDGLQKAGCRIIHRPSADRAPFRLTFETPEGERIGIIAYAFLANSEPTRNRPKDEHRFQLKYGSKDGNTHHIWQDPFGLYTTILVGINPKQGFFVGADPVLHDPTKMFISIEFKQQSVEEILRSGWHYWERERHGEEPIEVLVGGTQAEFLRFVRFEREALGEDQGHRQLLAERLGGSEVRPKTIVASNLAIQPAGNRLHALAHEFEMEEQEVLDLIANTSRLKMAVRGWVAEQHLVKQLRLIPGVSDCHRINTEGQPDVTLRFEDSLPLLIECKNVLRKTTADGAIRLDFQRTRTSLGDPCSRYYSTHDFDVVAACLHSVTERWEFRFSHTLHLAPHQKCLGKLTHNIKVDHHWSSEVVKVLRLAAQFKVGSAQ